MYGYSWYMCQPFVTQPDYKDYYIKDMLIAETNSLFICIIKVHKSRTSFKDYLAPCSAAKIGAGKLKISYRKIHTNAHILSLI